MRWYDSSYDWILIGCAGVESVKRSALRQYSPRWPGLAQTQHHFGLLTTIGCLTSGVLGVV